MGLSASRYDPLYAPYARCPDEVPPKAPPPYETGQGPPRRDPSKRASVASLSAFTRLKAAAQAADPHDPDPDAEWARPRRPQSAHLDMRSPADMRDAQAELDMLRAQIAAAQHEMAAQLSDPCLAPDDAARLRRMQAAHASHWHYLQHWEGGDVRAAEARREQRERAASWHEGFAVVADGGGHVRPMDAVEAAVMRQTQPSEWTERARRTEEIERREQKLREQQAEEMEHRERVRQAEEMERGERRERRERAREAEQRAQRERTRDPERREIALQVTHEIQPELPVEDVVWASAERKRETRGKREKTSRRESARRSFRGAASLRWWTTAR